MHDDIAEAWAVALESDKFKRTGRGTLCQIDDHGNPVAFCALGVLCELAVESGVTTRSVRGKYGSKLESARLPAEVMEWSGIKTGLGRWSYESTNCVAIQSDMGIEFRDLAQTIRRIKGLL